MTLCLLLHFFLLRNRLALKKQPGLTLYQVAEALDAVLALFHRRLRDGRTRLTGILDLLQGRAARNAAAARSHERCRLAKQPPDFSLQLQLQAVMVTLC